MGADLSQTLAQSLTQRWLDKPVDTVAILWRLDRQDGVSIGFAGHDRDLWRDNVRYLSAPGMVPSALELDDNIAAESIDIAGALTHDALSAADLAAGRWDNAGIAVGLADWHDPDRQLLWLFHGRIGRVSQSNTRFSAAIDSGKVALRQALVPETSPGCRAAFGDHRCQVARRRFEEVRFVSGITASGAAIFQGLESDRLTAFHFGYIHWYSGARAGLRQVIVDSDGEGLIFDRPQGAAINTGDRARLVQGCDKTLTTCRTRFANAINFQGEPFLPGNDLLTRFPGG